MPVVKVRDRQVPQRERLEALRAFQSSTGLYTSHCRRTKLGWALGVDKEAVHLVMNPEVRATLASHGLEVLKTPHYRAECTLVGYNVTGDLGRKPVDEMAQEIGLYNNVRVTHVKWRCSQSIWIELNTPEEANRLLDAPGGILLASGNTLTHLSRKKVRMVPQCKRCFSFGHELSDCRRKEQRCFVCGAAGHVGEGCLKNTFSCINCRGIHGATASGCPARLKKEKELEEDYWSFEDCSENSSSEEEEEDPEEEMTRFTEAEVRRILEMGGLYAAGQSEDHKNCAEEAHERATHAEIVAQKLAFASVGYPSSEDFSSSRSPSRADYLVSPSSMAHAVPGSPSGERLSATRASPSGEDDPSLLPPRRRADDVSPPASAGVYDPLPVSPSKVPDSASRPRSRLEDPISPPLYKPVPTSPRRAAPAPSNHAYDRLFGSPSPGSDATTGMHCDCAQRPLVRRNRYRRLASQFSGLMDDVAEVPETMEREEDDGASA